MKQSAVEWLFEQVVNLDWRNIQGEEKIKIFEKAKEMEKQQVVNAYVVANGMLLEHSEPMAEQYYDETFKYKVLVRYKEFQDAPHPLLDGEWIEKSKVICVSDLTDLNRMFERIINIKILE